MHKYLNLGCGSRCHPDWVNVDFVATKPGVIAYNLVNDFPFPDQHFEVVYHSHVLEHFNLAESAHFLKECYRVLKPGGIIRVVVPDLEQLAKQYISMLDKVESTENDINTANYEWAVIELIDQMVRRKSGGEMLRYWQQPVIVNEQMLIERMGNEYLSWKQNNPPQTYTAPDAFPLKKTAFPDNWFKKTAKQIPFEETGEKHQWMYDRFSLKKALRNAGFTDAQKTTAFESLVPQWPVYQWLDVENGAMRKPDSLYMEARKQAH